MKIGYDNIQAIMFDLDGTLIDSIPAYYKLMAVILKTVGLPEAPKTLVAEFMNNGLKVLEKMIPDEMMEQKDELIRECITVGRSLSRNMYRDKVNLFPGVKELFSILAERSIYIAIVSSTEKKNIERKLDPLDRKGTKNYLDMVIAIEDAPKRKPAPDPLLECARRLSVPPEECVYVGDSRVDIQAGNSAGMRTIGVLTGIDDFETLQRENATMILDSVSNIKGLLA